MAPPVRLGLIGAGRWGQNYIRTIAALEGVRLARLASRNPESTKLVPAGCTVVADWREVLDLREVDGVIVATPPAVHAEIAIAAVEAGVPVLVEKPLTLNVAEARALRDLVVSRHASAMVAHTHLFHPAYRALKSLVPRFGKIQAIRSEAGGVGPYRQDVPVLWDWGAHDVAMCLDLLCSVPEQAKARIVERRPMEGSLGEVIEIELVFAAGVHASIRVGNVISKRRLFSVRCEHATLVYDDFAARKLDVIAHRGGSPTIQPVEIAPDLPLTVAVREFAAASASRCQDTTSLELGVKVVEVLAVCEASAIATVADK